MTAQAQMVPKSVTPKGVEHYALSIRQPFASAILSGVKKIEYRSWFTKHRGHLVVHAGVSKASMDLLGNYPRLNKAALVFGAALGTVEVVDCREVSPKQFEWDLRYPFIFRSPIPCKGGLGLWKIILPA